MHPRVYPDQPHSLPLVRQHQYLAMEDFFDGAFASDIRTSHNKDLYFDMDSILYDHADKPIQQPKQPKLTKKAPNTVRDERERRRKDKEQKNDHLD